MLVLALVICVTRLTLFVLQAIPTLGFARALKRFRRTPLPDDKCPKAAVILCLRGGDPFLTNCLQGLFRQDYPDFTIFVIVDSPQDPAFGIVQDEVSHSEVKNVVVEILKQRLTTCSLKGSSIAQAMSHIDPSFAVVAMLDSDVIPHATWLRELVAPLTKPEIGVSSGTRWYMPSQATWGAFVRYYWNAAATVQMYWSAITWGGSVALRGEIARHPDMIQSWTTAVSTDTVILRVVRSHGLKAEFVPSLMMLNRETCSLPSFFKWVQRQMVVVRLYHRAWMPVITVGLLQSMLIVGTWVALGVAAWQREWTAMAILLPTFFGLWIGYAQLFAKMEARVRDIVLSRGETLEPVNPNWTAQGYLAMFLTQLVYAVVLLKACFIRRVSWRGVEYQVDGPHDVSLISYEPFEAVDRSLSPAESL
jgi:cellulose synthase/poly-beta-1,6-N-acetylglucosamine synthase-like glycosyltransferase